MGETLEDAKAWLRARFEEGADCPCCGQFVKLYKRKLNSNMAAAMIAIYRASLRDPDQWIHLKDYLLSQRRYFSDAPALRHWGLIREKLNREDGLPRAGYYQITDLGVAFVLGQGVPKYTYQYNQKILERDGCQEMTTIHEALGSKFNYQELMSSTPDGSTGEGL